MHHKINYVEFATRDMAATKAFFAAVFGWDFTDYGPDYASFSAASAGLDGGFFSGEPVCGALVVLFSEDLKVSREAVLAAGGEIVKDIFGFPGGERFHFREPGGNELAIWAHVADPKDA